MTHDGGGGDESRRVGRGFALDTLSLRSVDSAEATENWIEGRRPWSGCSEIVPGAAGTSRRAAWAGCSWVAHEIDGRRALGADLSAEGGPPAPGGGATAGGVGGRGPSETSGALMGRRVLAVARRRVMKRGPSLGQACRRSQRLRRRHRAGNLRAWTRRRRTCGRRYRVTSATLRGTQEARRSRVRASNTALGQCAR